MIRSGLFNLFFSSILLPLITIALLWRRARRPRLGWAATLVLAAGVTGFSVLVAPWGTFGLGVRSGIGLLFIAAVIVSLRRPLAADEGKDAPLRVIVKFLIGIFFGSVAIGFLQGYVVPAGTIDLGFPLTNGTYLVEHGGSSPPSNVHFQDEKEHFAVDLVELNAAGMRARGIFPADPRAYAIFGASVVSPCDGTVAATVDQFPDAAPDPKHPLGNHVVLRCGDASVILANLQRGSIVVRPGASVRRGAPLARAGQSGLAPEPQLHIHAERNGTAVPMTFGGRWLVRNAIVRREPGTKPPIR